MAGLSPLFLLRDSSLEDVGSLELSREQNRACGGQGRRGGVPKELHGWSEGQDRVDEGLAECGGSGKKWVCAAKRLRL